VFHDYGYILRGVFESQRPHPMSESTPATGTGGMLMVGGGIELCSGVHVNTTLPCTCLGVHQLQGGSQMFAEDLLLSKDRQRGPLALSVN
jgi:hypothetical protein